MANLITLQTIKIVKISVCLGYSNYSKYILALKFANILRHCRYVEETLQFCKTHKNGKITKSKK